MKLTVEFVLVLYFLTVFATRGESFKILKKLKDYIYPTTSTSTTTSTTPVPHDYVEEDNDPITAFKDDSCLPTKSMDDASAGTVTSVKNNCSKNRPEQAGHNAERHSSKESSSSEESRERPPSPELFPTIAPQKVHEVYPGMSKTSTTPRSNSFNSQKQTTEKTLFSNSNYDNIETTQSTANVLFNNNRPEQTTYYNQPHYEIQTTTLQSYDVNYMNQVSPDQENTSTERIPITILQNYGLNNTYQSHHDEKNTFIGEPQSTNLPSNEINYLNKPHPDQESTPSPSMPSKTTQKSETGYGKTNEPKEDLLIFPDNPCLNSTKETSQSYENKTSEVKDCLHGSSTSKPEKVPVPVGEDGGRNIVNAPTKDCGKGRKLDDSGNCRKVVRK